MRRGLVRLGWVTGFECGFHNCWRNWGVLSNVPETFAQNPLMHHYDFSGTKTLGTHSQKSFARQNLSEEQA